MSLKRIKWKLLLIMSILYLPYGCSSDDEGSAIAGDIVGIELKQLNNAAKEPSFPTNERLPKEAYLLAIGLKVDSKPWDNSIYYYYELSDPIASIKIITVTDFNEEYPAGSDVSELFKQYPLQLKGWVYDSTTEDKPIFQITQNESYIYKALLTYPAPGTYQFKVELTLRSGLQFVEETEAIELY